MPSSGLYGLLPGFAATLRTLHLYLRAPGLTSRDVVGLGRLTALQELHMDVQTTAEVCAGVVAGRKIFCPAERMWCVCLMRCATLLDVQKVRMTSSLCASLKLGIRQFHQVLVIGLRELQPLAGLTHLSIGAVMPPAVPGDMSDLLPLSTVTTAG